MIDGSALTNCIIESKNLKLEYYTYADKSDLLNLLYDKEVMKYVFKGVISESNYEDLIADSFARIGEKIGLGILHRKVDNKIIGFAGLHNLKLKGGNKIEIGFAIGRDYQKKGFGSEIALAQIEFCKKLGYTEVFATAHPDNLASIMLLEKVLKMEKYKEQLYFPDRGLRILYFLSLD